jgi:hypothetical protein
MASELVIGCLGGQSRGLNRTASRLDVHHLPLAALEHCTPVRARNLTLDYAATSNGATSR